MCFIVQFQQGTIIKSKKSAYRAQGGMMGQTHEPGDMRFMSCVDTKVKADFLKLKVTA